MVLHTVVKYFWYARLRTKNYPNFMLLLFLGNVGKIGLQRSAPTLGVVSYRDIVVEIVIIENEKIGSRN